MNDKIPVASEGSIAVTGPASSIGQSIDLVFWAVTLNAIIFSLGIAVAIIYLAVKYRRGHHVDRSNPSTHDLKIEIAWTVIPLGIALGLFLWASVVYFRIVRIPQGGMEIYVVGKQWMWKLQHPQGRWEMNELHVPAGRTVVLTMTSEDVIHSFYVPAFRIKQDVIPGQYTRLWFKATRPGIYSLFCAEFCGTNHSKMVGRVVVMEPADYERWLSEGNIAPTLAQAGERLFRQAGCSGCHGAGASVRAPRLEGIYGRPVAVQVRRSGEPLERVPATTLIADDRYLHDSIVLPEQEVAAGYRPIMPTYRGRLTEEQIFQLVAYIKSLGTAGVPEGERDQPQRALTPEDYRARLGFTPNNIGNLTREEAQPQRER